MCQPPDARTPSERTSLPSGNTAQAASPNNTHVDARNQSHPRAIPNTRTHQRRMRPRCTQRLTPALVSGSWVQCAKFRFGGILTPGRTSAWHHSPGEREKRRPRLNDIRGPDGLGFRGSIREHVRGCLSGEWRLDNGKTLANNDLRGCRPPRRRREIFVEIRPASSSAP
jgi:hypothetical protein